MRDNARKSSTAYVTNSSDVLICAGRPSVNDESA
jgi:hypothetical protein